MSNALFDETVTLYIQNGSAYLPRVIPTVKTMAVVSDTEGKSSLTVYIPLHHRRSLRYLAPSVFFHNFPETAFTIRPGDKLLPYKTSSTVPSSDAKVIRTVTLHKGGSRRLHHIKLTASEEIPLPQEETTDEGTES